MASLRYPLSSSLSTSSPAKPEDCKAFTKEDVLLIQVHFDRWAAHVKMSL